MAALTPEQLSALTPAYMAEVNPTSHHMYDTAVAFMVLNTLFLGLLITSLVMKGGKIDLEVFFLVPLSYLTVMGNAIIGFRKCHQADRTLWDNTEVRTCRLTFASIGY